MSDVFARVLCGDDGSPGAALARALAERVAAPGTAVEVVSANGTAGGPADGVLAEIERTGASLVVVGFRGHSRAVGIALGSVPTFLLHEAPCSVLVAREPPRDTRTIVVGLDGSRESARALAAAEELAGRLGTRVRPVAATRDAHLDLDAARALAPEVEEHAASAVDLLANLSEESDLVVVGSRGLRGIRSLGSVSERVAHEARCPVLVVREARG